jgi:glutathione S-transferase
LAKVRPPRKQSPPPVRRTEDVMKLYGAPYPAPNPRRVRIFLAEKGIDLPETPVDLATRGHKSPEHLARNSLGQVPTLELDDGTCISETVSICRYFEEIKPDPPMFGRGAVDKALVDMWIRRVELRVMNPVGSFWVHAHPYTAALLTQFKDFGESNRAVYSGAQKFLDREMADGRPFVAGDTYTMADICLQSTVDFAKWIGLELDADTANLTAWHARVSARPTARA